MPDKPRVHRKKFAVTVKLEKTVTVWADTIQEIAQVWEADREQFVDDILDGTDAYVSIDEAWVRQAEFGIVVDNDDDPGELVKTDKLPYEPVDKPEDADNYVPSQKDF